MNTLIEQYTALAPRYAQTADDRFKRRAYDRARFDVVLGLAQGDAPVVDLGCGPGHVVDYLEKAGRKCLGIDASDGMLHAARARFPQREFQNANLEAQPFGREELGGMIAAWSLIHLPREALTARLSVLASHLRPRAPLLLVLHQGEGQAKCRMLPDCPEVDLELDVTCYQREELTSLVESAENLEVLRVEGRRPYRFEAPLHHIFLTAQRTA